MSADTADLVESVEYLDHTPACEGSVHKQDPPPAQFLVDIHGCIAKFACAGCVAMDRRAWAIDGGVRCRHCLRFFPTFESAEWVVRI